jgi:alkanesulfonate monooxygenase SsuD/methylene tetrahydromethanopterin reductase-like flavin-dependent oxidoreductase (luciferase family)
VHSEGEVTLEEIGRRYAEGILVPQIAGTPEQIADELERVHDEPGADGFAISAASIPGSYEDFVDRVVPVLQERGRFRTEYEGQTLRDHLGLTRAAVA